MEGPPVAGAAGPRREAALIPDARVAAEVAGSARAAATGDASRAEARPKGRVTKCTLAALLVAAAWAEPKASSLGVAAGAAQRPLSPLGTG